MLNENTTPQELAELLGTNYRKIRYFYYVLQISTHYKPLEIPKKNGGIRDILAPEDQLKHLQKKIAELLEQLYKPRSCTKAFVKGLSIYENAKPHTRKSFVFNIDLKDFFPTINFGRVFGLLSSQPYNLKKETAAVIAHLCTVDGALPQGAPSSPIISNMICSKLDRQLIQIAAKNRATVTRYADDITFSFLGPAECLPDEIVKTHNESWHHSYIDCEVGAELVEIIRSNGFSINDTKTRLQSKNQKQVVTGLTVNKKVNIDRRYIRKTSAILHSIETLGAEDASAIFKEKVGDEDRSLERHLIGRLLYIYQIKGVQSPVYTKLAVRFNGLQFKTKLPIKTPPPPTPTGKIGKSLNKKCWVLENHDVFSQATGFTINNNLILTCAHFFTKNGDFDKCIGFRLLGNRESHNLTLLYKDDDLDLAILAFDVPPQKQLDYIDTRQVENCESQEKITFWGFPNYKPAFRGVSVTFSRITNFCILSGVQYAEIDKDVFDGNSGGPVLNSKFELIGVIARGADDKQGHNAFILASEVSRFLIEAKAAGTIS